MKSKLNLEMAARNDAKTVREENDFYATDPKTVKSFLKASASDFSLSKDIWECACGQGHISEALKNSGYGVISTDLIYRGYGEYEGINFLNDNDINWLFNQVSKLKDGNFDIITNPPYRLACEFALQGLKLVNKGNFLILYVKDRFLEGEKRFKDLFSVHPPKYVYAHVLRQKCAKDGDFEKYCQGAGSQFFVWIVWEKGHMGGTTLRWIYE